MASVKNKIRLGTLFLFSLLLFAGGVGIYYLVQLKKDAKAILYNNYESLDYAHTMQCAIDSISFNFSLNKERFEKSLLLQESNVTEPGEKEATTALRAAFNQLKQGDTSYINQHIIRNKLQTVIALNMNAIDVKKVKSEHTAEDALTFISLIAALIFIIAVTFSYNFPSVITNPIKDLNTGIEEIASKNYSHRIHINSKDEFGQISESFNTMAAALEYYTNSNLNKLLFEKARAEAVINSLRDASIGIDKTNIILFANNQALQLLSVTANDIVGKSVEEVSRSNDLFRFLMDEKNSMLFKIVVDDKENYFNKEVIELSNEAQGNKVIVLKNITSFKELDVAKTNFIATISHELKTPLASSDFGLKLLEDERTGNLLPAQKDLVQRLKEDNKRMLKILSELLNMSQVEAGRMQLNIQPADANIIADAAVATVIASAKEKSISIKKVVDPVLPSFKTDIEKTGWVLNNFLTNAIKNAPENSEIILSVKNSAQHISFAVKDAGIGIASEHLSKIFDRYYKVPGSKREGTGLGLAISKEFIEAIGGKIWVNSQIGMGSEFGFELSASVG
ncbi:MAG: ATP-binding protein [Agriterribacter sp.]